jgi:hypothetical protein
MKSLYMLTESDSDALLYEAVAERLTNQSYSPVQRRIRGTGIDAVRKSMKYAIKEIARMSAESGVCFIIAIDNDRAPHAACPDALSESDRKKLTTIDQHKPDRYGAILKALEENLGPDRSVWKIPVAVALPVEMIETWLIVIARSGTASEFPRFSRQDDASAIHFYHPAKPPAQLKDLAAAAQSDNGYNNRDEWAFDLIISKLDPTDLAARSASFQIFREWFKTW